MKRVRCEEGRGRKGMKRVRDEEGRDERVASIEFRGK